jgi:hypothetical protein
MAIHGGPDLPAKLSELSTWVDTKLNSLDEMVALFERQPGRRIFKTHTPLDGLPYREDVSYVVCGRDPRDAFLSMRDHNENFKEELRSALLRAAGVPTKLPFSTEADPLFQLWMTRPSQPWTRDGYPFGPYFHHLLSFWNYRHLPNIHLLHYRDLSADLPRVLDGLARFLGVSLSAAQTEAIVRAAAFDVMRDNAERVAPLAHKNVWHSTRAFFRSARLEAWRERLSPESQALYAELTRKRYPEDFLHWVENGARASPLREDPE